MTNKNKFKKATLWAVVDVIGRQSINFILSILIARLLLPEDFGEIAPVLFILSLIYITADFGVSFAIQNKKNINNLYYNTAFWISIIIGIILIIIVNISSGYFGKLFDIKDFSKIIGYASIPTILLCAQIVPIAKASRELDIRLIVISGFISTSLSGIITIFFAYHQYGKYALIIQYSLNSIISLMVIRKKISWNIFSRISLKRYMLLKRYGIYIYLSQLMETIYTKGYSLLIGNTYNSRDLGFYSKAESLGTYFYGVSSQVISKIAFPILSIVKNSDKKIDKYVENGVYLSLAINAPLLLFLQLTSNEIVLIIFGEKWINIAPLISISAFGYIFYSTNVLMINGITSNGNPKIFLALEFLKKVLGILIIIGFLKKNDIELLVYGYTLASIVGTVINYYFLCRILNIEYLRIINKIKFIFISCTISYFLCSLITELNLYYSIISKFILFFISYIVIIGIFDKIYIKQIINEIRK